ncbi:MAG: DUF1700 domain-containing protein [Eubacterium sp.]|nr:DUF1700 domain-containing protein [Eubacterium sp.]
MSVEKFLDELKFLLSDLPEEEREEALDFYRCYFEDAGVENEADLISELGSPAKVAYSIREGLKEKEDEGEYTETGYRTYEDINAPATRYAHKEGSGEAASDKTDSTTGYHHISVEERYKQRYAKPSKKEAKQAKRDEKQANGEARQAKKDTSQGKTQQYSYQDAQSSKKKTEKKGHGARTPLYIIGQILLGILKVLMVIAAICIVILLICVLIALVAAICVAIGASIGFLVVGIGLLITGAGLVGVAMIGIAFIAFAIFLLLLTALVAFCKKGLAGGIRGITNVAGNVVHGKKKKEA